MGLFDRKRTSFYDAQPYYTLGDEKTILVVGLGNPGKKYAATRHNTGFMALDVYREAQQLGNWTEKKDLHALIAEGRVGSTKVILIKPNTFMNESGKAVAALQKYFRVYNSATVVVYDELDVDLGTIRTRIGGGSAGHNGVKSVSGAVGEDYGRIRIGVGPKKPAQIDSADFVLQDFSKSEQEKIAKILREACTLIDEATVGELPEHTIKVS